MVVNLLIILVIVIVIIALLSIPYVDGYRRAYEELTYKGMSHRKAKVISSVWAFIYIF